MASSPPYQSYGTSVSPPYPSHTQLPPSSKKRPSEMSSASSAKRRKPSMMSTTSSTHPLRQTSFPPDGEFSQDARSPSVDTMSMVSGSMATGPTKKKRGRKPKNAGDDASLVGGRASTAVSALSGKNRRTSISRGQSPDEEDDEQTENMGVALVARTNEEKEKEKYYRSMLVNALDPDQYLRYERWRSSKLSDNIVRRLVNQTLSQSVPASVILAVKSVTKIFAGEIIERARAIQTQWLEASEESQVDVSEAKGAVAPWEPLKEGEKETRRGPLTPDHLREALRRYKMERAGGMAGLMGLDRLQHPTGVERFGIKAAGRRLLK